MEIKTIIRRKDEDRIVPLFVLIIILFFVMPSYVRGEDFIHGIAKLNYQLANGSPVNITVWSKKITPTYLYKRSLLWGGDKYIMSKFVISNIDIKVRNKTIFVPLSAYSDLGNPNQVLFERTKQGFKLIIEGFGGENSYKAILEFSDTWIQRRRVALDITPQQVWEETVYSFTDNEAEDLDNRKRGNR